VDCGVALGGRRIIAKLLRRAVRGIVEEAGNGTS
jgi:hypothetical protein